MYGFSERARDTEQSVQHLCKSALLMIEKEAVMVKPVPSIAFLYELQLVESVKNNISSPILVFGLRLHTVIGLIFGH